MGAEHDPLELALKENGHAATSHDLLRGIAARVGRLDQEFEGLRDDRKEDRALLLQVQADMKQYAASVQRVFDELMRLYQQKLAAPDPTKSSA